MTYGVAAYRLLGAANPAVPFGTDTRGRGFLGVYGTEMMVLAAVTAVKPYFHAVFDTQLRLIKPASWANR